MVIDDSKLFELLSDDKQKMVVRNCISFVESLWTLDHNVKHFTDHGINHSYYILKMIESIAGISSILNNDEAFILILGIILHDIGMQMNSDRNIISLAIEKYGANEELRQLEKNDYIIRENHHLLTSAMIEYHYLADNYYSALSFAIKGLDFDYVNDLIDVCRYHSKLDIKNCPEKFTHNRNNRKKLIAILLRLGDELDISKSRGRNIDLVLEWDYPKENKWYWCYHRNTVAYIHESTIYLYACISSHNQKSDDNYEAIKDYYGKEIRKCKQKNQLLIEELSVYGIDLQFCIDDIKDDVFSQRMQIKPSDVDAMSGKWILKTETEFFPKILYYIPENKDYWIITWGVNTINFGNVSNYSTYGYYINENNQLVLSDQKNKLELAYYEKDIKFNSKKGDFGKRDKKPVSNNEISDITGRWQAVAFVRKQDDIIDNNMAANLYVKELTVDEKSCIILNNYSKVTYERIDDFIWIEGDCLSSHLQLKDDYLFMEWKSGDYKWGGFDPFYYVFKKADQV